ncbi:DapH/DapD/GlmU-related protein [Angustibacter luteus]|uniref:DapH/DapD/GlmU-related protein n=1 Tax=Angustibacter luteus TaxID=658456 RepID=A0ABW1JD39_9ACTN
MLLAAWVRMNGGLWTFRARLVGRNRRTPWGRLQTAIYKRYLEQLGGYISLLAEFADEPRFPHKPAGVFIAPYARIGSRAVIYQHVTIGKNDFPGHPRAGAPTIGDDVYIGAGAKIIGRITIGDGARIGAGAVIVKDVPAGATATAAEAVIREPRA